MEYYAIDLFCLVYILQEILYNIPYLLGFVAKCLSV